MEWNITRLERLILEETLENSYLEFKASNSLLGQREQRRLVTPDAEIKNNSIEASKDISAMANANGGSIIYGMKQDSNNRASLIDGGYPVTDGKISWIEDV